MKHKNSEDYVSEARTATFALPDEVTSAVFGERTSDASDTSGKDRGLVELGVAQDRYFSRFGDRTGEGKGDQGTIGPLTFGAVSRSEYYSPAVVFAFVPFLHEKRGFAAAVPENSLAYALPAGCE